MSQTEITEILEELKKGNVIDRDKLYLLKGINLTSLDLSNVNFSQTGEVIVNLEKELLKFDHQQVGRIMAEEWNFPELLTDVIGDHHFSTTIAPAISLVSHLELQQNDSQLDYIISHCEDNYNLKPESTKKIIDQALKEAATISL